MTKFVTLVILAALRLLDTPINEQTNNVPFATPSPLPPSSTNTVYAVTAQSAKIIDLKASLYNRKVLLQWTIEENETVALFEVEKSTDGINFSLTALVFGTGKADTDNYSFYEKATDKRLSYRIKIVKKDKKIEYSDIVMIEPDHVLA